MSTEWLLIPVFILCALIMKWFVKLVDYFIAHSIIHDETELEMSRHHAAEKAISSRSVNVQSGSAAKARRVSFREDQGKGDAALADEDEMYAGSGSEILVSRVSAESFRKEAAGSISASGAAGKAVRNMSASGAAGKAAGNMSASGAAGKAAGNLTVSGAAGKAAGNLSASGAAGETVVRGRSSIEEESDLLPEKLTLTGLLDKFRKNSNVRHDKDANTIEIGTARPTQIRIQHYEQQ